MTRSDEEIRRDLVREIRAPKCKVCGELHEELVNARLLAREIFEKYQALRNPTKP